MPVAYISTGRNFPDALAGGAAAAESGGPLLLVGTGLPDVTAAELTRLQPQRIVVLGGTGAVSGTIFAQLASFTAGTVTRIDGAAGYPTYANDRYATAASICAATFDPGVAIAYVATGLNFPDALAGGAAAGASHSPLLIVGTTLPAVLVAELARLKPGRVIILGGKGAVSDSIKAQLGSP